MQVNEVLQRAGCPKKWEDVQHEDTLDDEVLQHETMLLKTKDGITWAYDDVTNGQLDPDLVTKARQLEMEYFRGMKVYDKVPRSSAAGCKIIRTRWIDVNKGDLASPNYRSRLVGKEYNDGVNPDLYASTPPLEAMRFIVSHAATLSESSRCIMVNDISRAYFNAKAARDLYVEIPAEDREPGDENMVAKLNLCLYGTRDAAFQWGERVAQQLEQNGFVRGEAFPSVYVHEGRGIVTMVHGDDYLSSGTEQDLMWLKSKLEVEFEVKSKIVGAASHLEKEAKVLNRVLRIAESGWELEADQRHVELVIEDLKLGEAKGLAVPGVIEPAIIDDRPLSEEQSSRYRSLAARLNYLSQDRMDIMYSVKELCRCMSSPTEHAWTKLVRVAKYLKNNPRLVMKFAFQNATDVIEAFSDANWAGCHQTRRSTSGGVLMRGSHLLKAWSKTQSLVALSSAESEFYATVRAATEALGVLALMGDFKQTGSIRLHVDASAALGVIQRQGIGKIRHLATGALWLQSQQLKRVMRFEKIAGSINPADTFTKYISRDLMGTHVSKMSGDLREGRANATVQLHQLQKKLRQIKHQRKLKLSSMALYGKTIIERFSIEEVTDSNDRTLKMLEVEAERKFDQWKHRQCSQVGVMRKDLKAMSLML